MPKELEKALRTGKYTEAVNFIEKRGCINAGEAEFGHTPLMLAIRGHRNLGAKMENLDFARWLIHKGANIDVRSKSGATAAHYLTYCGVLEEDEEFFHFSRQDRHFFPATDCIQILEKIRNGGQFKIIDNSKWHLIHVACRNPSNELFRYIIRHTPDINVQTISEGGKFGHNALSLFLYVGYKNAMGAPIYDKMAHYFDRFEILISHGIDVNRRIYFIFDGASDTAPIFLSLQFAPDEISKRLLDLGVDVKVIEIDHTEKLGDFHHNLAIRAAQYGNIEVAKILVKKGVDFKYADNLGWTVLHHAVQQRHAEMVKYLLSLKLDANQKTIMPYADTVPSRTSVVEMPNYLIADIQTQLRAIPSEKYPGEKWNEIRLRYQKQINDLITIRKILEESLSKAK